MNLNLALVSRASHISPPRASRGYALVSVAMYDAVVAAQSWQLRHRRRAPGADGAGGSFSYPSDKAALGAAAARVLAYLFPERPAAQLDRMADDAARTQVAAGAAYPSDVEAGLELGRAVGDAVVARARADGSGRVWTGRRPAGRGYWSPPPGTSVQPVDPLAGTWKTWAIASGDQFRAPPPPAYGSPRFLAEARELVRMQAHLTPEQMRIAKFWEGGRGTPLPPGVWNEVAMAYVRRDRLDTLEAARVLALMNVAMADAGVAVWDSKYAYWSARPENAIRDLGLDPRWRSFLATPPFPAYTSAHSGFSAAAAEVLAALFPKDSAAFRAKAEQAGLSRLYGGIHYRSDHVAAMAMGRKIGHLVLERANVGAGR
jgi:hypothetical protein